MDIGIITHYDVHNHGALLQLNALVKVLKNLGFEAKALQFDKNYDFLGVEWKAKYEISLRSIPIYLKYIMAHGICQTIYNVKKRKTLNKFKREESLLGSYYTHYKDMHAVIIGSDEVFALHTGPTPVFFGHALPTTCVIAYAACFGPTTVKDINEKHCEAFVKSGIGNMKYVSVRDQNSCDVIFSLLGYHPAIVCDPVLLYGYEKELRDLRRLEDDAYLLVYAYDSNMNKPEEIEAIKSYARRNGLKIVSAGFFHFWCDKNVNVDPVSLLGYFKYAQSVVTDTFHGSVLSILTNREFAVKMRGNGNKLGNLLDEYGLKSRIVSSEWRLEDLFEIPISYDMVNLELRKRREMSIEFLKKALRGLL